MRPNERSEFHSVCALFQEMLTLKYTCICMCCICICIKKSFQLSLGFRGGSSGHLVDRNAGKSYPENLFCILFGQCKDIACTKIDLKSKNSYDFKISTEEKSF